MKHIKTTLTTSGNSVAVRLPKRLLELSGLGHEVQLEARAGKIIISSSSNPRTSWSKKINALLTQNPHFADEFSDLGGLSGDGLEGLAWGGLSYDEWLNSNAKRN